MDNSLQEVIIPVYVDDELVREVVVYMKRSE